MPSSKPQTGLAAVNGLDMYYEVHGRGHATASALHRADMTIDMMGPILPGLAESGQVIAPEQQGHGHTADADRPLTYERMGDDTAALVRRLGIGNVDVVGFSMGGAIALQMAIRHPTLVRKLVLASTSFASDGMHTVALEMFPSITPELFTGTPIEEAYLRTAPDPAGFPRLVEKLKQLDATPFAWPKQDIQAIAAPTLIVVGDSDVVRLEHAVELFGLRGGGVMGDLSGLPASRLAVLPAPRISSRPAPGSWTAPAGCWPWSAVPRCTDAGRVRRLALDRHRVVTHRTTERPDR